MSAIPVSTKPERCCNQGPEVATLRCYKCGAPICAKCSVRTAVGYLCRACVRQQQAGFETAYWYDFVFAVLIAGLVGLVGLVTTFVGFFVFLIAPAVGLGAAELIRLAIRRRRSRYMPIAATIGFVLGAAPGVLGPLLGLGLALVFGDGLNLPALGGVLWQVVLPLVYMVLGAGSMAARLRGIVM